LHQVLHAQADALGVAEIVAILEEDEFAASELQGVILGEISTQIAV
jgi:hypothetical protein